jgi:hypothetical protein
VQHNPGGVPGLAFMNGAISPLPLYASTEWTGKMFTITFAITIHPNWSTIRLSRGDGTRQNLCKKNCRTVSVVFGVSFRATATWPNIIIMLVEISEDSLQTQKIVYI